MKQIVIFVALLMTSVGFAKTLLLNANQEMYQLLVALKASHSIDKTTNATFYTGNIICEKNVTVVSKKKKINEYSCNVYASQKSGRSRPLTIGMKNVFNKLRDEVKVPLLVSADKSSYSVSGTLTCSLLAGKSDSFRPLNITEYGCQLGREPAVSF